MIRLGRGIELHTYWKYWGFGRIMRLNGSMMWGWNPYTSYRFGPFDLRIYAYRNEE